MAALVECVKFLKGKPEADLFFLLWVTDDYWPRDIYRYDMGSARVRG